MIRNSNKTKALVVSRFRTGSPPHDDLVLSGVSIRANPNLDILGGKFDSKLTFEDQVRGIVSQPQNWNFEVGEPCILWTPLCYFVAICAFVLQILQYCSPVCGSAAECHLRLLERQVYSVARLCQSFLSLCHRWLGLVCCTRLIRTLITVCSASFHLHLLEFDISGQRPQLIH